MRKTLFHGNDDGFTFIGAIIFLLVLLLLVPAVSGLLAGNFQIKLETLREQETLFEERQAELEAGKQADDLPLKSRSGWGL